jgi:hypothetical protein
LFASKLVESGVASVEMLCALLDADVLSVDRLVNEMKFPRPMAQAIKKIKFSPISGHIGEDDLDLWLKLSLGGICFVVPLSPIFSHYQISLRI